MKITLDKSTVQAIEKAYPSFARSRGTIEDYVNCSMIISLNNILNRADGLRPLTAKYFLEQVKAEKF